MRNLIKPVLLLKKHSCLLQNQINFQALKRLAAEAEAGFQVMGMIKWGKNQNPKIPTALRDREPP